MAAGVGGVAAGDGEVIAGDVPGMVEETATAGRGRSDAALSIIVLFWIIIDHGIATDKKSTSRVSFNDLAGFR